jgi:diguanylate cyclase (GGDEF)-like protein
MKIEDSRPVSRARTASKPAATSAAPAPEAARKINDFISVAGIPEGELTPKVRASIMILLQEVDSLRQEIEGNKSRISYLEQLADQDSLVPVSNRRAFVRELSRQMSFAERYGTASTVVYFDINGLKIINDTHGHAAGDAAIRHVAEALVRNVRESDIVGRLGGDEFGVILTNADRVVASEKAMFLAADIEARPMEWEGKQLKLDVAHGAYTFKGGDDVSKALDEADRDMYARKQGAKGTA